MKEVPDKTARLAVVAGALVLSGLAAVAVEVLWQRLTARLLGSTTAATSAVLAAYMGGLALGAWLAGRRGDRLSAAGSLRAYLVLELIVWLAASALTLVLAAIPPGIGGMLSLVSEGMPRLAVRVLVATLVLAIPTTAMGATLPLAVRAVVGGSRSRLLRGVSVLYAANTAGAVLGALLAPFVLLPVLGVRGAALIAATGSLAAAGIAWLGSRGWAAEPGAAPAPEAVGPTASDPAQGAGTVPQPRRVGWLVAVAAGASGAAALGLEVIWTRGISTAAGSTVHAFGTVLALVLVGLALGSGLVAALDRRITDAALSCALTVVLGPTVAMVCLRGMDAIPEQFIALASTGHLGLHRSVAVLATVGAYVIALPAVFFGATLPLAIRATRSATANTQATARAVGRIYAANTVGALAGAMGTGLILLPTQGQGSSAAILVAVALVAGLALIVALPRPGRQKGLALALVCVAATAALLSPRPDPTLSAAGVHLRASAFDRPGGPASGHRLYYAEGPEAPVLVAAVGARRTFFVAGRPEASTDPLDVRNQYLLGHLPALLVGKPTRSLVIGLGSGMTTGALLHWGAVTVAELNHAVPGATRTFADLNHGAADLAVIRIEDGRIVLAEPGAVFDVITTDPVHPYIAGSASLYTTEHLRLVRDRLPPGGAVSEWIPLHQMGLDELRAIFGSFVDVFPDAELYLTRADAILVGGGQPRDPGGADHVRLFRAGWSDAVAADMRASLIGSPEELAALRVAGPDELRAFVGHARRNVDDDPWIELSLPGYIGLDTVGPNSAALLALRGPTTSPAALTHRALQRAYALEAEGRAVEALAILTGLGATPGTASMERTFRERELSASLARTAAAAGRVDEAVALARAEAAHGDATPHTLLVACEVLRSAERWDDVDRVSARLRAGWPDRPEGWMLQGESLFARARFEESIDPLERANALDVYRGYAWLTLSLLGRSHLLLGGVEAGRAAIRESLLLHPHQPELEALLLATPEELADLARSLGAGTR